MTKAEAPSVNLKKTVQLSLPLLTITLGLLGICGWVFDSEFMRGFLSDGSSMKVNTALLLIAGGSSLYLLNKQQVSIARVFIGLMILLSLLILAEHLFYLNLHIDELLGKDRYTDAAIEAPGRTSLLTALDALITGTALFLLSSNRFRYAQLLAGLVFLLVYISLMGHLFHISGFYYLGHYSGVAFHTALALLLLAAGILVYQPQKGWLALFYRRLARKDLLIYFLSYGLGAAPLFVAVYFFIIQHGNLSPASDIIVLIALTGVLSVPVAYFLLKTLNGMERDLARASQRLELALGAASLGTYELDILTGTITCSEQFKRNFGVPPGATFSLPGLKQAILPYYRQDMETALQQAIERKELFQGEYRVSWPDGSRHWISIVGKASYDEAGNAVILSGVTRDVTKAKIDEQALQQFNEELAATNEELAAINEEQFTTNEELMESQVSLQKTLADLADSEARFRGLVQQAPVAINVLMGKELIIESANDMMLRMIGKKPEDIIGRPYRQAIPELEGQPFLALLDNVYESGESYFGSEAKAMLEHNGQMIDGYFNFIYQPIKDEQGATYGIMIVATEVTGLVAARKERENAEQTLRLAVEGARIGYWHLEPPGMALSYNDTLAAIFGYEGTAPMTYAQAIGQVNEEYRPVLLREIENAITAGTDYDVTYTQRRFNDNQLIWLRSMGKVSQDEQGSFLFSGIVMDVTEEKKDELRKSDFIHMVSHELKTPLTSLSAIIQVASMKLKGSEDKFLPGAMEKAGIQVRKMNAMINGFLNISRLESGKISIDKSDFLIDDLIAETVTEARMITQGQAIIFEPCGPVTVNADQDKIGSVISNLISNAVKYAPKGKTVTVKCEHMEAEVRISIADEGMGISPDDRDKIFNRYYRVSSDNMLNISGFGIGLYLSAEIVHRHEGRIWVESEPGQGSTFYFTLPVR